MTYRKGQSYRVTGADDVERTGTYIGREQGVGVTFDVFKTQDRIPFQPGTVIVYLLTEEAPDADTLTDDGPDPSEPGAPGNDGPDERHEYEA